MTPEATLRNIMQVMLEALDRMLDRAIDGSFLESSFDESVPSALESKMSRFLNGSASSARNLAEEKGKIAALIADVSHQTKTPIANILLYASLLAESELTPEQQAQAEAKQQVESIRQEVEAEQYRLTCAQQETAAYVQKVKALHQQTLTYLDQLEQITPQQPQEEQPAQPDAVDQAVSDIDDSVQRLVAKAMAEAKEENEKARQSQDLSDTAEFPAQKVQPEEFPGQGAKEPEHDDMEQTTRIDFGELQFGRDYEIK
mgnify:CR=1 FL=1